MVLASLIHLRLPRVKSVSSCSYNRTVELHCVEWCMCKVWHQRAAVTFICWKVLFSVCLWFQETGLRAWLVTWQKVPKPILVQYFVLCILSVMWKPEASGTHDNSDPVFPYYMFEYLIGQKKERKYFKVNIVLFQQKPCQSHRRDCFNACLTACTEGSFSKYGQLLPYYNVYLKQNKHSDNYVK